MLPIFFLLIGTVAALAGVKMLSASLRVRRWPVVSGRIVERGVGPSTTTGASRAGRYFEPRVKYVYDVDGKAYSGQRIGLAAAAYDEVTARRKSDGLPDTVEVHYDPRNPGEACLQPSSYGLGAIALVAGAVCLCIAIGSLIAG